MLIIIFNTSYWVINSNKSRILAANIMWSTKKQIFRYILFLESLPQILIWLREAISLSLVVIVVTEMFIWSNYWLGKKIIDSQSVYEISTMYAVIFLSGILWYLLNLIFIKIENRYLHWNKK
jgi:NitT/TauT family transport system permease protein